MSPPSTNPTYRELALIEQGKLALQAIQYHEQAARYHAEAANLKAALLNAEQGNTSPLQEWLANRNQRLDEVNRTPFESTVNLPHLESIGSTQSSVLTVLSEAIVDNHVPDESTLSLSVPTFDLSEKSVLFWSSMETAARARIAARRKRGKAEPPASLLAIDDDGQFELPVMLDRQTPPDGDGTSVGTEEGSSEEERIESVASEPLTLDWKLEPVALDASHPISLRSLLKSAPFWISFLVHVGVVATLGVIVIQAAKKAEKLAIVSAPVEADNVLTETPMELTSPSLDTNMLQPTQSDAVLSPSDLISDRPMATLSEVGTMPSERAVSSGAVSESVSSSLSSMSGSKLTAGAEFFGVKATGNVFVYVVDSSPSMRRDGAFDAAKAEIVRSLSSMKPKQRFFVSFFGKEVEPMSFDPKTAVKYPIAAQPDNIKKTLEWLNRVSIQKEGWPPNDALSEAIRMQPDGIFLLFDGDTKVDVAKFLRKENRTEDILSEPGPKVPIHVIHFFSDEFQKAMRQVAQENGGTYRFVPRPQRPNTGKK